MRVVWSALAKAQLFEICQYYKETGGARLSKAIRLKIFEKTKKLARFPELGQQEFNPLVAQLKYRYLVSGNFKIIYKVMDTNKVVFIASLFDTRQNPNDLKIGLYE